MCDIRLTVNDLLAQMIYEGNVKVISDDGKAFTFDSPEGGRVAPDVRRHGQGRNGRQDRPHDQPTTASASRLLGRQAPFYQTGPNLIRDVKTNNPDPVQQPGRRAGAARQVRRHRQGPDGASPSRPTRSSRTPRWRWPSSSPTRAPWSTSPSWSRSIRRRRGVRGSVLLVDARRRSRTAPGRSPGTSSRPTRTSSRRSPTRPTSTRSSSRRSSRPCSTTSPAQQALSDAVAQANALIK